MYMIGAHIISKCTGSYVRFAQDRILNPLGMDATTFSPLAAHKSGKLSQSWTAHAQPIPFWFPQKTEEFNAGHGGLITSVVDLVGMLMVSFLLFAIAG